MSATVRLHLLWELAHCDRDVGTLAAATGQSVATVSAPRPSDVDVYWC
ncbi:hypothetical protein [Mycobacterium sp.]|nr:hypothetical protein [Mycobacterium sp.]HZA12368.1 hypothetical protein [Mycobacterium sp.]